MTEVSMEELHAHLYDASKHCLFRDSVHGSLKICDTTIMLLNDYTDYKLVKSNPRRLGPSRLYVGGVEHFSHYSCPILFFTNNRWGYNTSFLNDHDDASQDSLKIFKFFVDENTFIMEKTCIRSNKKSNRTSRLEFIISRGSTSLIEEKMFKHKNAFGM